MVRRADPFGSSARRRLVQHPKFFFFDTGVLNGLLANFQASADRIGDLFEHLVFNQIFDEAAARDQDVRLSSYRTENGAEADLIFERGPQTWAIELKASSHVRTEDLRGLRSFREFHGKKHRQAVFYLGEVRKDLGDISLFPSRVPPASATLVA